MTESKIPKNFVDWSTGGLEVSRAAARSALWLYNTHHGREAGDTEAIEALIHYLNGIDPKRDGMDILRVNKALKLNATKVSEVVAYLKNWAQTLQAELDSHRKWEEARRFCLQLSKAFF